LIEAQVCSAAGLSDLFWNEIQLALALSGNLAEVSDLFNLIAAV